MRSPMTLKGSQRLRGELENLKSVQRPAVIAAIAEARAHGDLRENAEYAAAKERQGFVNARIHQIEQRIRDLSLYSIASIPREAVGYGSRVTLETEDGNEEKYELVFPEEANAAAGMISIGSPLGKALLNIRVQRVNGTSFGVARSALRWAGYVVSAIPLGAGFLWALLPPRRAWHDYLAGTVVVRVP